MISRADVSTTIKENLLAFSLFEARKNSRRLMCFERHEIQ